MRASLVFADLLRHPIRCLVRRWNYKSAVTSSALRSVLFFGANISSGWDAATSALITELVFRFATSGFYGALTQAFRTVQPARTGTIAAIIVLPVVAHSLEFAVHWWSGTVNLGLSIAVSFCFTGVSTAFNLFAMRRGILIVGEADVRPLRDDLAAMPRLIAAFVCGPLRQPRGAVPPSVRPLDLIP